MVCSACSNNLFGMIGVLQLLQLEQKQEIVLNTECIGNVFQSIESNLSWLKSRIATSSNGQELDFKSLISTVKDDAETIGYLPTDKLETMLNDQQQQQQQQHQDLQVDTAADTSFTPSEPDVDLPHTDLKEESDSDD